MSLPEHKPMIPEETEAVERLRQAVECLPKTLSLHADDFRDPRHLTVWKQDAPGCRTQVAAIKARIA